MKKILIFIMIFLICGTFMTFIGCTGVRDIGGKTTKAEDGYKNDADFERGQDRQRLDHGAY